MAMKHLAPLALMLVMMAACGSATAGDSTSSASNKTFAFLRELGLNVDQITQFNNDGPISFDSIVELNKEQEEVLLKKVGNPFRMEDGEIEGSFSLLGIRALPAGYTLILYSVEFGDGSSRIFAIYDSEGNTTDYLDTGYWTDQHGIEASDDYTTGESYGDNTQCVFDSPTTMKLERKFNRYSWKSNKENYEQEMVKEFWRIEKEYLYRITDKGTFELADIKTRQSGPVEPEMALLEEISDMSYYTGISALDHLNELALRPDVKQAAAAPEGQASYRLQGIVEEWYRTKPEQLLEWMSQHRDLSKNAVTGILEQCFSTGWISKESLIKIIDNMPDGETKKYIEDLTAQWGPADAVG